MARINGFGLLLGCTALFACSPGPFSCPNDPATPLPSQATVCAHIAAIGCLIDPDPELIEAGLTPNCEAGYRETEAALSREEFERVLRCYAVAESCEELEGCNQSCGPDGEHISYRPNPRRDGGATDVDSGQSSLDSGLADAGTDSGVQDSGIDSGLLDSGLLDSGLLDSGVQDSGVQDSGVQDAGRSDSGVAGPPDAGPGGADGG